MAVVSHFMDRYENYINPFIRISVRKQQMWLSGITVFLRLISHFNTKSSKRMKWVTVECDQTCREGDGVGDMQPSITSSDFPVSERLS